MYYIIIVLIMLSSTVVTDNCGNVDKVATCRKICEARLPVRRKVYQSEAIGTVESKNKWTCACYTERFIVVDDDPLPPERGN